MNDDVINPQWHVDVSGMDDNHLRNRIAWAKRQIVDTWEMHGYEPKYGAGGFTDTMMNKENEEIEKHVEVMEKELEKRNA